MLYYTGRGKAWFVWKAILGLIYNLNFKYIWERKFAIKCVWHTNTDRTLEAVMVQEVRTRGCRVVQCRSYVDCTTYNEVDSLTVEELLEELGK